MTHIEPSTQPPAFRAVITPHRSLGPRGFTILMTVFGTICFITGLLFFAVGAWPVLGFFGLDVLLLYVAFKLNYRTGRMVETVDITPTALTLTRVHPSGHRETFGCNPFYARVLFDERPDGRTHLSLAAQGQAMAIAGFLNDDEKRDLAGALREALLIARGGPRT